MFASLQQILDSVPYPTGVGCIAIGLGFVVAGLASPIKSKADRARKARTAVNRAPARKLRIQFFLTLLGGALLTAGGTWLTLNGARLDSDAKAKEAKGLLDQTRKENDQARKDFEARLQTVLVALNAAKTAQTNLLTDEKIKGFSKDVLQWADDFSKRKPDKQREFEQAKIATTQQEIQISADSMPLFSFTLRFIQQIVDAYEKRSGEKFSVSLAPLPQNFYDPKINNTSRMIRFAGDGQWQFSVNANPPANESNPPMLQVNFTSTEGRSGQLWMRRSSDGKKFEVRGGGILPIPDSAAVFGEYQMEDYEDSIRRIFERLLEGQLSQNPTPTPTASASP